MADTLNTPAVTRADLTGSYVEWGAVIAGGVLAAAISFVLLTFGMTIGLSMTSPWQTSWLSARGIASLAVLWAMIQQIGAVMAGAYVAGRMRKRWAEADENEVDFRDGLHGGLVWAVCVLISAGFALSALGSAGKTAADLAGRAASNPAAMDPVTHQIDVLLRPAAGRQPRQEVSSDVRNQLIATFARAIASGTLDEADRTYAASIVSERAGVPADEASRRVQTAYNEASTAAKAAADKARRGGILTGLVTAIALLVSLAAGWWAGIRGGNHRDNAIPARFVASRRIP